MNQDPDRKFADRFVEEMLANADRKEMKESFRANPVRFIFQIILWNSILRPLFGNCWVRLLVITSLAVWIGILLAG